MKQVISSKIIGGGISPTIKTTYSNASVVNIIKREDGFKHPGIIEIYETSNKHGT